MRILVLFFCLMMAPSVFASDVCTFNDWTWNSSEGRAKNFREVKNISL